MPDEIQEVIEEQAQQAVEEQAEQIADKIEEAAESVLTLDEIKKALADIAQFCAAISEQLGEVHGVIITLRDNQTVVGDAITVAAAALETADEVAADAVEAIDNADEVVETLSDELPLTDDAPPGLPEPEVIETPALEPQQKNEVRKRVRMI